MFDNSMFDPHITSYNNNICVSTSIWLRLALLPIFLVVLPFLLLFLSLPLISLKVYGLQIVTLQAWGIGWIAAAMTAALEWPLWVAINPWRLRLDLTQRSYQLIQGWGPWARTRLGTTEDIRCLYLQINNKQWETSYKGVLVWKMRRLSFVIRITYDSQNEAQEWLQDVANKLDVAYLGVNPILNGKSSSTAEL